MISLPSYAKINLFFRVLSKRSDGYHNIASLYQKIHLSDQLTFTFSHSFDQFSSNVEDLQWDPTNLIYKATQKFRLYSDLHDPISVKLIKKIPIGAGLGGGSSNAATTLLALNQLFDYPLTENQLLEIAKTIGADVPFFIKNISSAYCTGIGDILTPVEITAIRKGYLLIPDFAMSTPEVYRYCQPNACSSVDPQEILNSFSSQSPLLVNDLESAAFGLKPLLREYKQLLEKNGPCLMTGSGSALFFLGDPPLEIPSNIKILSITLFN